MSKIDDEVNDVDGAEGVDRSPEVWSRTLYRSRSDRLIGGLCGGLGRHFEIDPVWFRLGFVLLAVGGGSSLLIYLVLWIVVPEEPDDLAVGSTIGSAPARPPRPLPPGSIVVGLLLLAVGSVLLVNAIAPDAGRFFWPVVLVAGGLTLLAGGWSRDRR